MYIRNNIAKGVEVSKIVNNDVMIWMMLKKYFFNLCHDIYIGNIYIVPAGSVYLCGDEFHILESEIAKIPDDAEVLICGDLNAHTYIDRLYKMITLMGVTMIRQISCPTTTAESVRNRLKDNV